MVEAKFFENNSHELRDQVCIILCGRTLDQIKCRHVVINDIVYNLNSSVEAIDFAFKIIHTLKFEYPYACPQVWTFLNMVFYNIENKKKTGSDVVSLVIGSLNCLDSDLISKEKMIDTLESDNSTLSNLSSSDHSTLSDLTDVSISNLSE